MKKTGYLIEVYKNGEQADEWAGVNNFFCVQLLHFARDFV
jgi:hypothetical protein